MNLWLDIDEPRKHFFDIGYELISNIDFMTRNKQMDKLYALYAIFMKAYKNLSVVLQLHDRGVKAVFDGIEASLCEHCPNDPKIDEIFTTT